MSDNASWGGQPDQPGRPGQPGQPGQQPSRQPGGPGSGSSLPRYPGPGAGQPPPGYGQPPYGTPGYGQWATRPPAPAPGGVPLRPLAVGDILSGAFTLIRHNPAATLGLAAIVQTVYGICGAFISWQELNAAHQLRASLPPQATPAQASHALGQFFSSFSPYLRPGG